MHLVDQFLLAQVDQFCLALKAKDFVVEYLDVEFKKLRAQLPTGKDDKDTPRVSSY